MRTIIKTLSVVMFALGISACSTTPDKYMQWIENPENQLRIPLSDENTSDYIQYKPATYLALKELQGTAVDSEKLDEVTKKYSNTHHFEIRLFSDLRSNLTEEEKYRLEYDLASDFLLVDGQDTLPCSLYHFEKYDAVKPYTSILLGFEKHNNKVHDLVLLNKSSMKQLHFKKGIIQAKHLKKTPKI